mmetsp:Transcript_22788/g.37507  ORF Transcript_22788/g.37507 Transcript_22788/m.37507 type:complete len:387 (+) Transcript_22788:159-1319(+)|eukprot:CAMPEP_0184655300 /NCGR_PEP_ID=MMETSP0308-20130426/12915_1 /TAXON_ID=38269 /ORGANISM="Gloeochaete witrockiana, Strain SAG 46.84" /LENGTH=386 /DNA_ID=CAMNT_0027091691 /DNA_START=37 /DNA_END=1197 /DNA_ORIENTATION=+
MAAEDVEAHIASFTLSLLREFAKKSPSDNVTVSPYSLSQALVLVLAGAKDETHQAILRALSVRSYSPEFLSALYSMLPKTTLVTIDSANAIWVDKCCQLKPSYVELVTTRSAAMVSDVDFLDPESTAEMINAWSAGKTKGKIPSIVEKDELSAGTTLILTNAVFFKADWMFPFDKQETKRGLFTVREGETVEVDFMYQTVDVKLGSIAGASYVYIPYKDDDLQMLIIRPDDGGSLVTVESQLTPETLFSLQAYHKKVHLCLPRFRVESKLDLVETLKSLGMETAFTEDADFSHMGDSVGQIKKVFQKVYVDVNEEGTEAAAATLLEMERCMPKEFRVDRPFLWFIVSMASRVILFAGRMIKPNVSLPADSKKKTARKRKLKNTLWK